MATGLVGGIDRLNLWTVSSWNVEPKDLSMLRLFALFLLIASPALAEPRQFGNILYDLPGNWRSGRVRDGYLTILSRLPDDECELCYMYIALGAPFSGDLSQFLTDNVTRFVDEDDHDNIREIAPATTASLGDHAGALSTIRVGRKVYLLAAVQVDDTAVLLGFQGPGREVEDIEESFASFSAHVLPMWENLRFVALGDDGNLPAAVPGDLAGIHWGLTQYFRVQLDGTGYFDHQHHRYVFFPDGHFYEGTPPKGISRLDRRALLRDGDPDFGVYRQNGRALTLTFADGDVEEFVWDGEYWERGDLSLRPVETLPNGTFLDGGLSSFSYTGFSQGSGLTGGIATSSRTTFDPDGTYSGRSYGSTSSQVATTSSSRETGGRYTLRDGLVIMTPTGGGPQTRALVFRIGDEIMVNSRVLSTD